MNNKKEMALRPRTGRRLSFSKGKKTAKHDLKASDEEGEPVSPASPKDDPVSPGDSPPETKKGSKVGGFLKDSLKKSKQAIQKAEVSFHNRTDRPLSALLKRPASRSGSRERRASKDSRGTGGGGGSTGDFSNQGWGSEVRPPPEETNQSPHDDDDGESPSHPIASVSGLTGNSVGGASGDHHPMGKPRSTSVESEEAMELPSVTKNIPLQRPTTAAPKKIGGWGQGEIVERPGTAAGKRRGSLTLKNRGIIRPPTSAGRPSADGMIELTDNRSDSPVQDLPYIEDITTSDFGSEVAKAPSMAMNAMTAYKNLEDSRLMKQSAFGTLDTDIDLSLLLNQLSMDNETRDEPNAWTWDYLFTCVAGDMKSANTDPEIEDGVDVGTMEDAGVPS